MDPQANAEMQVCLAVRILHAEPTSERAVQLAELVLALARWRADGGWEPRWRDALGYGR
jgi:hypothetical protein